jgi:hypothetical protein
LKEEELTEQIQQPDAAAQPHIKQAREIKILHKI